MKKCCRCKKEKKEVQFNFKNKTIGIRQKACKECTRIEVRRHYLENRGYYLEKTRKRNIHQRNTIKKYVFEYLSKHPCLDCGETDPVVLEFDHVEAKIQNVSNLLQKNYPITRIIEEIAKCSVRCANCHRRKTAKDFGWYKENMRP